MSLHGDAVRALGAWAAPDDAQEELRLAYLAHLAAHPDGMLRDCAAGHVTASTLVVDDTGQRTLLTLHGRIGRWLQLGGHCEPRDRTLAAAAAREAAEESGIAGLEQAGGPSPLLLSRHLVHCAGREAPARYHYDVQYLAVAPAGAVEVRSAESADLRWFPLDGLPDGTDASVRALVGAARRRLAG